jgi:uncharacterized membrane protein
MCLTKDTDGRPLEFVTIEMEGTLVNTTGGSGEFAIDLDPGTYELKIMKEGYETVTLMVNTSDLYEGYLLEVTLVSTVMSSEEDPFEVMALIFIVLIAFSFFVLISLVIMKRRSFQRSIED